MTDKIFKVTGPHLEIRDPKVQVLERPVCMLDRHLKVPVQGVRGRPAAGSHRPRHTPGDSAHLR